VRLREEVALSGFSRVCLWNGFKVRSNNVPMQRPGVYRFTNLVNGKCYVGISEDVAGRCKYHGPNSTPKFGNAIRKYGREFFLCEPLFYWTDGKHDRIFLMQLETELIIVHDSIRNGYNVKAADGGIGPYGPEFSELQVAGWVKRRIAGNEKPRRGELSGQSKLTEEQVLAIRAIEGSEPRQVTADRYGITYLHVYDIQRRKSWAWLEGPPRSTNRRRGGAYTVAGAVVCSPEQHAVYSSMGGRANAANLAADPVRRASVLAQRGDSIKANWDRVKSDPEAYAARCELYKVADHQSPQARENHRRAALIREAKRRALRESTIEVNS
jgi:hypothetical protein